MLQDDVLYVHPNIYVFDGKALSPFVILVPKLSTFTVALPVIDLFEYPSNKHPLDQLDGFVVYLPNIYILLPLIAFFVPIPLNVVEVVEQDTSFLL